MGSYRVNFFHIFFAGCSQAIRSSQKFECIFSSRDEIVNALRGIQLGDNISVACKKNAVLEKILSGKIIRASDQMSGPPTFIENYLNRHLLKTLCEDSVIVTRVAIPGSSPAQVEMIKVEIILGNKIGDDNPNIELENNLSKYKSYQIIGWAVPDSHYSFLIDGVSIREQDDSSHNKEKSENHFW